MTDRRYAEIMRGFGLVPVGTKLKNRPWPMCSNEASSATEGA